MLSPARGAMSRAIGGRGLASTRAQPLHRDGWPRRRALWLVAGLLVVAGLASGADRFFSGGGEASRPDLQRILDGLVSGPQRVAPGATAYVTGAGGSWTGGAGIANAKTAEAMTPDARMRIESNSKTWLTAVVLQLAEEGKLSLDDTVARWLPGLLPYGDEITIRQLMTDSSGLVDDFDGLFRSGAAFERYLRNVKDPRLRKQWTAFAARLQANPETRVDPISVIRLAAWQPLLFAPGSRYHHSNIGWKIAGLIAAKAGAKPLPVLYQERIIEPLGLTNTSYQPQGTIAGPHARGYVIGSDGGLTEKAYPFGMGADGGIVTDAAEEATFITALLDDQLGVRRQLLDFWGARGGNGRGCPGNAFLGIGSNDAGSSYVYADHTGTHVAVLLLNGSRERTRAPGDQMAEAAARRLYCGTEKPDPRTR
jgi:D-alanyl-D-alanine carboxypeptidase